MKRKWQVKCLQDCTRRYEMGPLVARSLCNGVLVDREIAPAEVREEHDKAGKSLSFSRKVDALAFLASQREANPSCYVPAWEDG